MDKRVKNVIIVDDTADNFGGTAQIAYITAVVLRDRGYNVVYFAGCGPIHSRLDGFKVVVANEQPFLSSQITKLPVPLAACTVKNLTRGFVPY